MMGGSMFRLPSLHLSVALMALALLLATGWMFWPPEPAGAQDTSRKSLVYFYAAVDDTKSSAEALSLENLGMSGGVTIDPAFSPDHYSYTMTVPYQELGFTGKFISPYSGGYENWGFVVVGDLTEYERLVNRGGNREHMLLANSGRSLRSRYFTLQADEAETIEIGVYKWRSESAIGDPWPGAIFKRVYTLTVNYEPPDADDTGLYDLTISDGWLDFDPFDTEETSYTVYVARDTESVVITPTTTHPDATATVKGGDPANAVAISKGGNIIPIVVTAADGNTTQTYSVTVFRGATHDYSAFVTKMYKWRNNPEWARHKDHKYRWDRALKAFGETVQDTTIEPLTSAEAQGFADRGSAWHRWVSVADALRDIEASREMMEEQERQSQQARSPVRLQLSSTVDTEPQDSDTQDSDSPNGAPVVSSALADVSGLEVGGTQDISLSGVFSDADSDALTITAASSDEAVATVAVASDGSNLTVTGVTEGSAAITVTARDGGGSSVSDAFDVSVVEEYAALIAQVRQWRNDPQWTSDDAHTDRWDRVLLAFGEPVSDATLTPMTAAEAQGFADRGSAWSRWVEVAEALRELESAGQQDPANTAPTVSSAIGDASIVNENGTQTVSLSGVFSDADSDSLTVTAASDDEAVATVSVASDHSSLTLTAKSRGTATITVTADDGNGGTVSDAFAVRVKAAPVVASALADVSMEEEQTRDISLAGVFSDADNDRLTISASSSDDAKATVTVASDRSKLTLTGMAAGTATITVTAQDSDGNRVSDTFDVSVAAPQQQQQDPPPNQAPVVSAAQGDLVIVHAGGARTISLAGAFRDPDGDALTISAVSSNTAVATVTVAAGGSSLTLNARSRGAATITVRAEDGNGGTVSDAFTVTVKAAPLVASALPDLSGLEAGATREVSLSGVFRDPDGDALTISAASSNPAARVAVSADGSSLTLTGVAQGQATIRVTARDPDGNQVRDEFSVSVVAAPQPTPEPQPEPPSSELTAIAARYDANSDGAIDATEWRRALSDYSDGKLTYGEMFQVLTAYRSS